MENLYNYASSLVQTISAVARRECAEGESLHFKILCMNGGTGKSTRGTTLVYCSYLGDRARDLGKGWTLCKCLVTAATKVGCAPVGQLLLSGPMAFCGEAL